jgi:sporulation protein YlmC with PRC-barrel domain
MSNDNRHLWPFSGLAMAAFIAASPPVPAASVSLPVLRDLFHQVADTGVIKSRDGSQVLAKGDLIGDSVVSRDGVDVGKVEDVILDKEGKVTGIVVQTGGLFGIGGKSIGLSTSILDMNEARTGSVVLVNMSSDDLRAAPPLQNPARK